jgi:hypothetical protein
MPDFDTLAERADAYGALWAKRMLERTDRGRLPSRDWSGTMEEARRVVQTFAGQTGFLDRERLALIVQHSARASWGEAIRAARSRPRELR